MKRYHFQRSVTGVKNLPAMQEMRVRSLGQEDPLEKEMATHSSILALEISSTLEPGGPQSMGWQRDMTEHTGRRSHSHTHTLEHEWRERGLPDVCQAGFIWFPWTKLLRGWGPPGSCGGCYPEHRQHR